MNQLWRVLPSSVAVPVLLLACSGGEASTCGRKATCGGAPHETGIDQASGNASSGGAPASTSDAGGASVAGDPGASPIVEGGAASGPTAGGASGEEDGGRAGDGGAAGVAGTPEPPTVLILLDGSSSMLEATSNSPSPWSIAHDALMDETFGVLKPFADRIRFGFTSYRGSNISHAEDDPECAALTSVGFGLDNYDAIQTTYDGISTSLDYKWETPTGHVVRRVTEQLLSDASPSKKYIFLLTDGAPSTCQVLDPSCGQDLAIAAVQAAYSKGIVTRTIGLLGDGQALNTGCEPQWGRCGLDHIQDLSNAGSGEPVHPPPDDYIYQQCSVTTAGLTAEYTLEGGTAPALTANSAVGLATLLQKQFQEILEE